MKLKAAQKRIKDSLLRQLGEMNALTDFNLALVDDYIYYCAQEEKMQDSVEHDGLMIDTIAANTGLPIKKENPCIKAAVMYNKQKLAILKQLEISPSTVILPDESGDGDDL